MGHLTHSSILAWGIPWTHGAWQATVHKVAKNQTQLKRLSMYACIGRFSFMLNEAFKKSSLGLPWWSSG